MAAVATDALVAFVAVVALGAPAASHVSVVVLPLFACRVASYVGVVPRGHVLFVHCHVSSSLAVWCGGLGFGEVPLEVLHVIVPGFDPDGSLVLGAVYVVQSSFPLGGFA